MYIIKCKKKEKENNYYISATPDILDDWIVSKKPALFKTLKDAMYVKSKVENIKNSHLEDIEIIELNKFN